MYGFMNWQWFKEQARMANEAAPDPAPMATAETLRVIAGATPAPSDGRCCSNQQLQLEPCYPYSADWRLRCRGCGRWYSPDTVRPEPIPVLVLAADRLAGLPLSA